MVSTQLARNVDFLEPRALALVSYSLFARLETENYFLASLLCEEVERKKKDFDPHSTALVLTAIAACEQMLVRLPGRGEKMSGEEKRLRLAALRAREDYEEFARKNVDYVDSTSSRGLLMPIEQPVSADQQREEGGEIRLAKAPMKVVRTRNRKGTSLDPTDPLDAVPLESTGDRYFRERIATKIQKLFEYFADLVARRVPHQRKQWPVQSLTMILAVYARRYDLATPAEPLFRQIGDVLALQGPHLYPQALASALHSFAQQGISHGVLFFNAPTLIEDHGNCFSVDQLAKIAHAYALLGMAHTRLFDAVTERLLSGGVRQLIGGGGGVRGEEQASASVFPARRGAGLFASSMRSGIFPHEDEEQETSQNEGGRRCNEDQQEPSFAHRLPAPRMASLAELLEAYVRVTLYEPRVFDVLARAVVLRQRELDGKLSAQFLKAMTDASHPVTADFLLAIAHLVDVGAYLGEKRVRAIVQVAGPEQGGRQSRVALSGFASNTAEITNRVADEDGGTSRAAELLEGAGRGVVPLSLEGDEEDEKHVGQWSVEAGGRGLGQMLVGSQADVVHDHGNDHVVDGVDPSVFAKRAQGPRHPPSSGSESSSGDGVVLVEQEVPDDGEEERTLKKCAISKVQILTPSGGGAWGG